MSSDLVERTPTPWSVASNHRAIIREVPGMADGYEHYMVGVLSSHSVIGHEEAKANAAFIVKAVNSYDAMRAALEAAREYIDDDVASMEPGWKSAKRIVEAIDAALLPTLPGADQ